MRWLNWLRSASLDVLGETLPFVLERMYVRGLPDLPDAQVGDLAAAHQAWFESHRAALDEVDRMAQGATERATTLEAKVGGVLGALAVLTAVIAGIAVATWNIAFWWDRALLLISAGYSLTSLLAALAALRPQKMHSFTSTDLYAAYDDERQPQMKAAALKLAYEEANANPVIRLANLLDVAHTSARNSVLIGVASLIALGISHGEASDRKATRTQAPLTSSMSSQASTVAMQSVSRRLADWQYPDNTARSDEPVGTS
jgi:hypothetical protein